MTLFKRSLAHPRTSPPPPTLYISPQVTSHLLPTSQVTLFKRSLELVQRTPAATAAVDFWQQRQQGCFFYYYDNGKAAVREGCRM